MKRLMDIGLALVLAIAFAPVMVVTAVMVLVSLGRPVLFRQVRAGLKGSEFALLKWRSMSNARDTQGELLSDELRVTSVGRMIRRLRIDELPSVVNILRGDLSFVGPRPLPASNQINRELDGARLAVRPGLTGLAQVSGNTLLSDHEKLAVDLYYVCNRTLACDLAIIWRTFLTVLRGERRDEVTIARAVGALEGRT